jgi:SAM-dependent methyltransferase
LDRVSQLLSRSTRASRIIEIGAGYAPVAPKAAGWNTHVVDHADQATLREKYRPAGVDVTAIEPVDTIWRDGTLDHALPPALLGRFDTMIASHVIEHMPDLIGFLNAAARVLTPDGTLAVALPDRRYCFDCYRPASTTGDVLEAHRQRRTRHSLRTAWDHTAYSATLDGRLGWDPLQAGQPALIDAFENARRIARGYRDDPEAAYSDFHAWQFTPAGFALIMTELGQLGLIDWRIDSPIETNGFEFLLFLRRGTEHFADENSLRDRRMALIRGQLSEVLTQLALMLPDAGSPPEAGPQAPARDAMLTQLGQIRTLLVAQDARLREIEATTRMLGRVLTPARALWRILRRR